MFDLSRLGEIVGGILNLAETEPGLAQILQRLDEHGIDTSQIEGLDPGQLLNLLAESGLDVAQLDAGQLSELSDHLRIQLPLGDLIEPFGSSSTQQ